MITAGPTREYLDPVRFISNPSTGKMGYALAEEAAARGARVILVSGPTHINPPVKALTVFVTTAVQMQKAVNKYFPPADIIIGAGAVGDFQAAEKQKIKIKKDHRSGLVLRLTKTPDILAELGKKKGKKILVGFAAETDNIEHNARKKLKEKNLDLIVLNDITRRGAGFAGETNIVTVFDKYGIKKSWPKMTKDILAGKIFDIIKEIC